jgi:hypothetical protein
MVGSPRLKTAGIYVRASTADEQCRVVCSYDLRERGQAAILRDVTPTANMQSRTRGKFRTIAIHTCEAARQKAEEVAKTPEFAVALFAAR